MTNSVHETSTPLLGCEKQVLSIVLPAFNEEENIEPLTFELREVLASLYEQWRVECVFVDDGSTDGTLERMREMQARYPELGGRIIRLNGNHGLTAAMDAGIRAARGRVIVTLDADLQNDPRDIPVLVHYLEEADAVVGVRVNRKDSLLKIVSSRIANGIRNRVTHDITRDTGCSLKAYRSEWVQRLKLYSGLHRFLPTLLRMEGATVLQVPVNHRPRVHGKAKYGFRNRLVGPFWDLLAVRWMQKRHLHYTWEEIE